MGVQLTKRFKYRKCLLSFTPSAVFCFLLLLSDEVHFSIIYHFSLVLIMAWVCIYKEYSTWHVPSLELELSQPLSRQRACPSPQNLGGGGKLACG
jgi:hypothetical protein